MDLEKFSRDDWIVGGVALLLALDALVFPWWSYSYGPFSVSASATSAPDGWLGVLALLVTVALIADLAIERLSSGTQVPAINGSRTFTRFVLAVAAAAFLAFKFLLHIQFSYFSWGFYLGVVLAAALVVLTNRARAGHGLTAPIA